MSGKRHLRLDESRARIRHHRRSSYEYLFAAFIYHLKRGEREEAELIRKELQRMKEGEWEKF